MPDEKSRTPTPQKEPVVYVCQAPVYLEFAGILSGQNIEIPMDDLMGFEGTIKVSGRPELVIEQSA